MTPVPRKAYGDFEAARQLKKAGLWPHLRPEFTQVSEFMVKGIVTNVEAFITTLRARTEEFQQGGLHGMHKHIGPNRTEFRSYRGTFGEGSLQIVVEKDMGRIEADVDAFSPYPDLVGFVGHAWEVLAFWKRGSRG